ncbi:MAG: nicotinamide-nucleotide amidase [Frankiales bacterium]|nr:nicotinamide-nucleotide amidase [Frankiales bacterium]
MEAEIRSTLGIALWGVDDETLPGVVHGLLLARGQTVAVAESLTGGLLGAALTSTPGSSATFRGGVTAYSSELKTSLLGASLEEGAVSASTARAMAAGVRERLGSSFGLALTGVAGPEEQEGQPAGTVHVAVAGPSGGDARLLRLPGDRDRVRQLAVTSALDLLRRHLLGGQADR